MSKAKKVEIIAREIFPKPAAKTKEFNLERFIRLSKQVNQILKKERDELSQLEDVRHLAPRL